MNYEKAYKEALERARLLKDSPDKVVIENHKSIHASEYIFPELRESEDVKAKKSLKILLQYFCNGYRVPGLDFPVSYKDMLVWLEKQDEQKPLKEGTFVNVDEVREDFIQEVYRVLDADPTNDRANQIIDAFDSLPTLKFEKQGEQSSSQVNEHAWLYLVCDVLTWKDGIGQYLDDPRVQELAKKLCSEYGQKLYKSTVS